MSLPEASGPAITPSSSYSVNPTAASSSAESTSRNSFVDRRSTPEDNSRRMERRQFGSSHTGLSDDGRELALAIDRYKVQHHRRYLTCDEMLLVLSSLGYAKQTS